MTTKNFILFAKQELIFGLESKAWIFIVLPSLVFYNISIILAFAFILPCYLFLLIFTANDKDKISIFLKKLSLKAKRYVF